MLPTHNSRGPPSQVPAMATMHVISQPRQWSVALNCMHGMHGVSHLSVEGPNDWTANGARTLFICLPILTSFRHVGVLLRPAIRLFSMHVCMAGFVFACVRRTDGRYVLQDSYSVNSHVCRSHNQSNDCYRGSTTRLS